MKAYCIYCNQITDFEEPKSYFHSIICPNCLINYILHYKNKEYILYCIQIPINSKLLLTIYLEDKRATLANVNRQFKPLLRLDLQNALIPIDKLKEKILKLITFL